MQIQVPLTRKVQQPKHQHQAVVAVMAIQIPVTPQLSHPARLRPAKITPQAMALTGTTQAESNTIVNGIRKMSIATPTETPMNTMGTQARRRAVHVVEVRLAVTLVLVRRTVACQLKHHRLKQQTNQQTHPLNHQQQHVKTTPQAMALTGTTQAESNTIVNGIRKMSIATPTETPMNTMGTQARRRAVHVVEVRLAVTLVPVTMLMRQPRHPPMLPQQSQL
jgi:hypothetical protein